MDTRSDLKTESNPTSENELFSIEQPLDAEGKQHEALKQDEPSSEMGDEQPKTPSIKKAALIAVAVAVILAAGTYWYTTVQIPLNEATKGFNEAVTALEARNAELDKAILSLQDVLKSKDKPLHPEVADAASAEIGLAQGERQEAPERPQRVEDIRSETKKLERMGQYADEITRLQAAQLELEKSIQQLKQVTAPEESFVIERIKDIDTVTGVEAVTEDNDPNGDLGKSGGYTAAIYFSSNQVSPADLYLTGEFTPIVDAGCDGGGAVEVYATVEDAEKRNDYLASFDGGILSSGSHSVLGTCVIRTSTYLKASQQQALEQALIDALTRAN